MHVGFTVTKIPSGFLDVSSTADFRFFFVSAYLHFYVSIFTGCLKQPILPALVFRENVHHLDFDSQAVKEIPPVAGADPNAALLAIFGDAAAFPWKLPGGQLRMCPD